MIKVERVKQEIFEPVRITLTEREDVAILWHIVNNSVHVPLETYCKDRKIDINKMDSFVTKLWHKLDEVHRPKGL